MYSVTKPITSLEQEFLIKTRIEYFNMILMNKNTSVLNYGSYE